MVALGLGWWLARQERPSGGGTLTRLTADSGLTTDPALSPDGKLVAYASDRGGASLDIWVQQVAGGEPIRLTSDPADEDEPSFSPDGSKIVFHSERESGSGVYVVSALGGEARLLARQGRRPRFSPDGGQIAYWVGGARGSPAAPGSGKIFVVAAEGGTPRQLQPEFEAARYPVWAPDGKRLLFLGLRDSRVAILQNYDWWITPVEAGPAIQTGAYEALRKGAPFAGDPPTYTPAVWIPDPDRILFAGPFGATTNVWQVALSSRTGKVDAAPQQLTFGTGMETRPTAVSGPSGRMRLLFAGVQQNRRVWTLGLDANEGKVMGQLQLVSQSDSSGWTLKLTPDGKKLVFASMQFRSGKTDIWLHDFETGKSVALTATPAEEDYPVLSPDGSKAAYWIFGAEKAAIYSIDTRGGVPEKICDDCGAPWGWSPDGKQILYYWANRRRVGLLDIASGGKIELLKHPSLILAHPQFSPDGRWISFVVRTAHRGRVAVAPVRSEIIPENDWIFLTDDSSPIHSPCWSPNGARIYFVTERDGFACVWQQPLDPATRRPLGPPSDVYHFHNAQSALGGLSVARDKTVLTIVGTTGSLWMSEF
jgi:Tol biopolymer transport system component